MLWCSVPAMTQAQIIYQVDICILSYLQIKTAISKNRSLSSNLSMDNAEQPAVYFFIEVH